MNSDYSIKLNDIDLSYRQLLTPLTSPCVSIYIPEKSLIFSDQDRKNLFRRLVGQTEALLKRDFSIETANHICNMIWEKNPYAKISSQTQAQAFFLNLKENFHFTLKEDVSPRVVVAESFHLKPLFSAYQSTGPFLAILLSSHSINIYEGNRLSIEKKASFDLIKFSSDLKKYESDLSRHLLKTSTIFLIGPRVQQKIFKEHFLQFNCQETALESTTLDQVSLYDLVKNSFKNRIQAFGNSINKSLPLLRRQNKVLKDLKQITQAALQGKIKQLLIAKDEIIWGEIKKINTSFIVNRHQANGRDDDILDDIAEETLRQGGSVLYLKRHEMPESSLALAIIK